MNHDSCAKRLIGNEWPSIALKHTSVIFPGVCFVVSLEGLKK